MNHPREVIFHRSANRPHLILGGDRELVLFSILLCALVAFSLMNLYGVLLAGVLWGASMGALTRMAKSDPLLRHIYIRHVRYQSYYPAKSPKTATADTTPLQWK